MAAVNIDMGVGQVVEGIMGGLDGLFTSDEERAQARLEVTKQVQKPHIMQALTNLKEAQHTSWFVAGWRPAIGWVCAAGLAYQFLVFPFASHLAYLLELPSDLPSLNSDLLITMTMSLLGLGGMRTFEKMKGVARAQGSPRPIEQRKLAPVAGHE